jgi:hypothetical protein
MPKKGKEIGGNGNGDVGTELRPTSEEIAARAFSIYEREGRGDGRDTDHWLRAERELLDERRNSNSNPSAGSSSIPNAGPTASSPAATETRSARRAKGI